jgi:type II secretory pathway pseudopilin PulG
MRRLSAHKPPRQDPPQTPWRGNRGFSLAEILVLIVMMAVLVAITAPSLTGLVDGLRLAESVSDVRTAFMETQRQAIRSSRECEVILSSSASRIALTRRCLPDNKPTQLLPKRIRISSNIITTRSIDDPTLVASPVPILPPQQRQLWASPPSEVNGGGGGSHPPSTPLAKVKFGILGTAEFEIAGAAAVEGATQLGVNGTEDPSGKIVFFLDGNSGMERRCIAISNTLGLTRTGRYTGPIDDVGKITTDGICRASEENS